MARTRTTEDFKAEQAELMKRIQRDIIRYDSITRTLQKRGVFRRKWLHLAGFITTGPEFDDVDGTYSW